MKIFLDSVNFEQIKEIQNLGFIDGLTTNPSLMSKLKGDLNSNIKHLCGMINGDVSIEVNASEYSQMIIEGESLIKLSDNLVLKLPLTYDGLKACKYFRQNNIKVNLTLCFSIHQAILAAKANASYVSLFLGRLEDNNESATELIQEVKKIFLNYSFKTKILAASIRTLDHVKQSALAGADIVTISYELIKTIAYHRLTDIGLEKFNLDWNNREH